MSIVCNVLVCGSSTVRGTTAYRSLIQWNSLNRTLKCIEMCNEVEITSKPNIDTSNGHSLTIKMEKVRINVGGILFKSHAMTLKRFPNTLLSNLDEFSEYYDTTDNEYFFDRNPMIFNFILDAYRTGSVHMPADICGSKFREELTFWKLSEQLVSECCWKNLYASKDTVETIETLKHYYEPDTSDTQKENCLRKKFWNVLHEPNSSVYAKIWGLFMSFIITMSVVVTGVETVSTARTGTYTEEEKAVLNQAVEMLTSDKGNSTLFTIIFKKPHTLITVIDASCFFVLTTELILVFFLSPRRTALLRSWLHMSEVVCSVAYWIFFICERNLKHMQSPAAISIINVCKYLTILKLVRLLRIAQNFPALKIMGLTLCVSKYELKMMGLMLFILTSLFGWLMYLTECAHSDTFDNMFTGMYWALITLTTVGYGNHVPSTAIGHVVAGACAVCGMIMLAMPIGIFASNFDNLYSYYRTVVRHIQATNSHEPSERVPFSGSARDETLQDHCADGTDSINILSF